MFIIAFCAYCGATWGVVFLTMGVYPYLQKMGAKNGLESFYAQTGNSYPRVNYDQTSKSYPKVNYDRIPYCKPWLTIRQVFDCKPGLTLTELVMVNFPVNYPRLTISELPKVNFRHVSRG